MRGFFAPLRMTSIRATQGNGKATATVYGYGYGVGEG
jgi:hypothetical protein